ncbi:MAG: hypothetical protein D6741_04705 [Planctomycetota bacterium]|nr:MAG: hypothetical protein D6741_04705 [Planctomycetota bacterium]
MRSRFALVVSIVVVVAGVAAFRMFAQNTEASHRTFTVPEPFSEAEVECRESFLEKYCIAHDRGDVSAVMEMVCTGGTTAEVVEAYRARFQDILDHELIGAEAIPLVAPEQVAERVAELGYTPNMRPYAVLRIIVIDGDAERTDTFLLGFAAGGYRIALPAGEQTR